MITALIPALNEEKRLPLAVDNLMNAAKDAGKVKLDVIIVDDASTDSTPEVIKKLEKKYPEVRSFHHPKNEGIGSSIRQGIAAAKYPMFMVVPGDNDADPKLLTKIMKHRDKAEMVMSYYLNKELRGRFRNFISTLYGLIYMTTFDVYIQYFNGVGIYSTKKLRELELHSNRFGIHAEMNTKMLVSGCTIYEIPGYMQTGEAGSKSIKLKNLLEVMKTYLSLVYEIKGTKKEKYNKKPHRIYDE